MAHRPRKRFGQNFLHDVSVIHKILAVVHPEPGQHLVEIGPGKGALTEPLLHAGIKLDVIELDRDLVAHLQQKFQRQDNLCIHSADALLFDFSKLAQDGQKLRILGNLPYNISTPLLFHLLSKAEMIEDMHFMLQKEVVDRICAEPGSKKYGRLSVMLQYYCTAERIFDVDPESFSPAPKIMSVIVNLTPHATPPVVVDNMLDFEQIVVQAFSQRRKTLRNPLKKWFTAEEILTLSIDPGLRAEAVTLDEFARLSNFLTKKTRNLTS
jgi:16S rRNA (adenine1518-N6/adenine1519-N6)-dimethyltransferase